MLTTLFKKGERKSDGRLSPDAYQVMLDQRLYEEMERDGTYGCLTGVVNRVADKIADNIYPEIEKKIMEDPKLSDRLINEVLIKITNRLSEKGLIEEENE